MVTQSQLKEILYYDCTTGIFTWIADRNHNAKAGDVAGSIGDNGYVSIKIKGVKYFAHRLVFLYITGVLPEEQVDHVNHIRDDNRWRNLRCANNYENHKNRTKQSNNTSGFNGVSWHSTRNKWRVRIKFRQKDIHLGYYEEKSKAVKIRKQAEILYGFHPNHGAAK